MEEKIYTINLRKELIKTPRWKRANKAISLIREFIKRHMKTDKVKINASLNERIWSRSREKPPMRVRVKATKEADGTVRVELFEMIEEEVKEEKKDETKKG